MESRIQKFADQKLSTWGKTHYGPKLIIQTGIVLNIGIWAKESQNFADQRAQKLQGVWAKKLSCRHGANISS